MVHMDSIITNSRLQEAVNTILRLNISEDSESGMVTPIKAQTRYTFTQKLTRNTVSVLTQFIRDHEPGLSSVPDDEIHRYLAAEGRAQLAARKKTQMRRHRFAALYFVAGIALCFILWIKVSERADYATPDGRIISLLLSLGALCLCWFNRMYFFRVTKKLENDQLTAEDCESVLAGLGIGKVRKALLYGVCILLVAGAVFLPQALSSERHGGLLQKYNDFMETAEDGLKEVERLAEAGEYTAAIEMATKERNRFSSLAGSVNAEDRSLEERYSEAIRQVYRRYVSGYWIGESSTDASAYTVYCIPESGDDFHVLPFDKRPTYEEAVAKMERGVYRVTGCTVHYAVGAVKSVAYYKGYGNCRLEMNCESIGNGTVKIGDRIFTRLLP